MDFISWKFLVLSFLILIGFSCDSKNYKKITTETSEKKSDLIQRKDSVIFPVKDFKHDQIINTSGKQIDLLYSSNDTFPTKRDRLKERLYFRKECLSCYRLKASKNYLSLASQLNIFYDSLIYTFDTVADNNVKEIEFLRATDDYKNKKFRFSEGTGKINYLGMNCTDASDYSFSLKFKKGMISFPSIMNVAFVEYDLDKNNEMEQYIFSARMCTQELTIFRIR